MPNIDSIRCLANMPYEIHMRKRCLYYVWYVSRRYLNGNKMNLLISYAHLVSVWAKMATFCLEHVVCRSTNWDLFVFQKWLISVEFEIQGFWDHFLLLHKYPYMYKMLFQRYFSTGSTSIFGGIFRSKSHRFQIQHFSNKLLVKMFLLTYQIDKKCQ